MNALKLPKEYILKPEDVGLSSRNLAYIDAVIAKGIQDKNIAGAVTLIARHGKIAQMKAYGKANEGVPMQIDNIFRLASMSKTICGVAMMQLVDQGKVALRDSIALYVPNFAKLKVAQAKTDGSIELVEKTREITIHDLLSMSGGMASTDATGYPGADFYRAKLKELGVVDTMMPLDLTLGEVVDRIATIPLASQPGTRWAYSNVSVLTASRIIELIADMPLDQYLYQYIFEPLGMVDTFFFAPKDKWSRFANVYEVNSMNKLTGLVAGGTDDTQLPFSPIQKFHNVAGGLMGTAYDYYRFAQMLLNGGELDGMRILSKNAVGLLGKNQLGDRREAIHQQGWGYLCSVQMENNAYQNTLGDGAFGWAGYWGTHYSIYPKEDLLAIYMVQKTIEGYSSIADRIYAVASGSIIDE